MLMTARLQLTGILKRFVAIGAPATARAQADDEPSPQDMNIGARP
jgi:hypothetical protein